MSQKIDTIIDFFLNNHPRNGEMARYSPRFPRDLYLVVHAMVGPVIPLTRVQK